MRKWRFRSFVALVIILTAVWTNVAFAAQIEIVAKGRVFDVDKRDALFVAEKIHKFFSAECGLTLNHDVKIVLVPDKEEFIEARIIYGGESRGESQQRANITVACSTKNAIILNTGASDLSTRKQFKFVVAHELVHQYQRQVSRGKHSRLAWLAEGSASVIAARIQELDGQKNAMEELREKGLRVLRKKSRPALSSLHLHQEWLAAMEFYGWWDTYKIADIAVLELLKSAQYRDLFEFFALIKDHPIADSFEKKFGIKLADYEREFDSRRR